MAHTKTDDTKTENKTASKSDDKMTVQEAGKLGGEATSRTHDRSFYEEIGSEGGKVSPGNFKNDPERAAEAGSHSHDNDNKADSNKSE